MNGYEIVKVRDLKLARDDMRIRLNRYRGCDCGFYMFAEKWLAKTNYILAQIEHNNQFEQFIGDVHSLLKDVA